MTVDGPHDGSGVDIPQLHRSLIKGASESSAIRTERHAIDAARIRGECPTHPHLFYVPELYVRVVAAAGKCTTIWTEHYALNLTGMSAVFGLMLARFNVPQPHCVVPAYTRKRDAVSIEGKAADIVVPADCT